MNTDFICRCEGDLERIAAVFAGWIKNDSVEKDRDYTIRVPNELWAPLFVDIYTDVLANLQLDKKAEDNIIQITFQVENSVLDTKEEWESLKDLTDDELLEALEELMDDLEDEDDDEEDEDKNA
jgi:hypothetical protein